METVLQFNNAQAKLEGEHKAKVFLWQHHYMRIFTHHPEKLGEEYLKVLQHSINLYEREDPYFFAVTINPPPQPNSEKREDRLLEDFDLYFVCPFQKRLDKKHTIKDYVFSVEVAPKTGRLHIHGHLSRKASKKGRVLTCTEIQYQIWASIPDQVRNKGMTIKHVCVDPVYNKKGWDNYATKNSLNTFSKNQSDY